MAMDRGNFYRKRNAIATTLFLLLLVGTLAFCLLGEDIPMILGSFLQIHSLIPVALSIADSAIVALLCTILGSLFCIFVCPSSLSLDSTFRFILELCVALPEGLSQRLALYFIPSLESLTFPLFTIVRYTPAVILIINYAYRNLDYTYVREATCLGESRKRATFSHCTTKLIPSVFCSFLLVLMTMLSLKSYNIFYSLVICIFNVLLLILFSTQRKAALRYQAKKASERPKIREKRTLLQNLVLFLLVFVILALCLYGIVDLVRTTYLTIPELYFDQGAYELLLFVLLLVLIPAFIFKCLGGLLHSKTITLLSLCFMPLFRVDLGNFANLFAIVPLASLFCASAVSLDKNSLLETSRTLGFNMKESFRKVEKPAISKACNAAFILGFALTLQSFFTQSVLLSFVLPVTLFALILATNLLRKCHD